MDRPPTVLFAISTAGTTRLVLVIGPWALKCARGTRGRRCNRYEADLYASVGERRQAMLCPVRWSGLGGWLIVMATATPLSEDEKERLMDSDGFPDWDYIQDGQPFEFKASDWGWINGRLVALDYSTPAHSTPEELAEMRRAAYGE